MATLKLFGMRAAYDEVMASGIKRRHEPPRIVGDLLSRDRRETGPLDHSRTKAKSPQTNGICERFYRTPRSTNCTRVAFRKKIYRTIDEPQADLDAWLAD